MTSEAIRLALLTLAGLGMSAIGRFSPRIASACQFLMTISQPEIWPQVWGIFTTAQNIPRAYRPHTDPFEWLAQAGNDAEALAHFRELERQQSGGPAPTIQTGPTETERKPRPAGNVIERSEKEAQTIRPEDVGEMPDISLSNEASLPTASGDDVSVPTVEDAEGEEPKGRRGKGHAPRRRADGE